MTRLKGVLRENSMELTAIGVLVAVHAVFAVAVLRYEIAMLLMRAFA